MAHSLTAQPSSPPNSESPSKQNSADHINVNCSKTAEPEQPVGIESTSEVVPPRKLYYFTNEVVEDLIRLYNWSGCTKVQLRDQIMSHANELIRQIIRKQGLHIIYPGQEESAFGDLMQTAWCQIERTLYKFRSRPHCRVCYNPDRPTDSLLYNPSEIEYGIITFKRLFGNPPAGQGRRTCPRCGASLSSTPTVTAAQDIYGGSATVLYRGPSKVFNMWSQISRTVILAYIKKEGRDHKNSSSYRCYVDGRQKPVNDIMLRFLAEAREISKYNLEHTTILDALERIMATDDKPYDGIIGKLVDESGLPRLAIANFMKTIRLRSHDFTDSPMNRSQSINQNHSRRQLNDFEEDQ